MAVANGLPPAVEADLPSNPGKKRVVVVGLGMVGVAFIEKLMKLDVKRREWDIVVIGEEPHLAYNRVGLTSFFQHRNIEDLYLNPQSWYSSMPEGSLDYHLNETVLEIHEDSKMVTTSLGKTVPYDVLVLATGSDALLPRHTPGHNANGVFVYRTIGDLERLIQFAENKQGHTGLVVGGGLLGLEAAKAMMDLDRFASVKLIERNKWVLSRQLDGDAGSMVVEQVRNLGLDVMLSKRVATIHTDAGNNVTGVSFEDGQTIDCSCICFAIGIRARDELAQKSGLQCAAKGGGIVVDDYLKTSGRDIYAIGECASWENSTFGLIAPGIEMADVLAFNLTQAKAHTPRKFARPDVSTKLKLLGVDVASFGDFFADRDGPKDLPKRLVAKQQAAQTPAPTATPAQASIGQVTETTQSAGASSVKALTYKDPFTNVYKKYLFTLDGKYLLGGMMIGDTKDYIKLVPMVKNKKALDVPPSEFIVGAAKGDDDGSDLSDDTQICSCHNVLKKDIVDQVKDGSCKSLGDIKSCTKAGTGCGGCVPLVTTIFNKTMASMGQEVKNHLCPHFPFSRADLFNIIFVERIDSYEAVLERAGNDRASVGCEVCKPAVASILASLFNKHLLDKPRRGLQDTNDRFLANIQRNGTFSVVPRVSGGEITPEKLIIIGTVAKKYGLYCKITGGQRIDMFGARKQDLLGIWQELIDGGMESGHAYAKSLRTIKSCVGTTWCRYGVGDSVGLAVRLEERYKSIRAPHKLKGGVSGCVRECAEAQNKDFGLVATDKGFNIYVGGNGGATPRHSELLVKDVLPDDVVTILDRYLAFYIRTADKLQRTARWIENLPGGIGYLRSVILDDKLGICASLEAQMGELVSGYFCEWTETLRDPAKRQHFVQFANTPESVDAIEIVQDRGQPRPAYWPDDAAKVDFRTHQWQGPLTWQPLLSASVFVDAPSGSSQPVKRGDTQLAIFKVKGKYYCTQQMCPHKRSFALSEGLIGEDSAAKVAVNGIAAPESNYWVSCPFHKRNFNLNGESAGKCGNDDSLSIATFAAEERDGEVFVKLPPVDELDALLGTEKWKVKKGEGREPFAELDARLRDNVGKFGRKMGNKSHLDGGLGEDVKAAKILKGADAGSFDW